MAFRQGRSCAHSQALLTLSFLNSRDWPEAPWDSPPADPSQNLLRPTLGSHSGLQLGGPGSPEDRAWPLCPTQVTSFPGSCLGSQGRWLPRALAKVTEQSSTVDQGSGCSHPGPCNLPSPQIVEGAHSSGQSWESQNQGVQWDLLRQKWSEGALAHLRGLSMGPTQPLLAGRWLPQTKP